MTTRTGHWWGTQTTLAKARAAHDGCHLAKWYERRYVGTWRYKTPAFAQQALLDQKNFQAKFKEGYTDAGLEPPARPWRWEII